MDALSAAARRAKTMCNLVVINQLNIKRLVKFWWLIVSPIEHTITIDVNQFHAVKRIIGITAPIRLGKSEIAHWPRPGDTFCGCGENCYAVKCVSHLVPARCGIRLARACPNNGRRNRSSRPIEKSQNKNYSRFAKRIVQEMYSVASAVNKFSITATFRSPSAHRTGGGGG